MDIISEIIAHRSQVLSDAELDQLLANIGRLKADKARREALQVLYRNINLTPNQMQSIVDHTTITSNRDLLRFAQKYARHYSYRMTQEFMIANEKMSLRRALLWMLVAIAVAVLAALVVPPLSGFLF